MRYWHRPNYWRWVWEERVGTQARLALALVVAFGLGVAGYLSAGAVAASDQTATLTTQRVVTVVRKPHSGAAPKVVTTSEVVTAAGATQVITVRRDGRTVVLPSRRKTITVQGPARQHVVTVPRTTRLVGTVTAPGGTVTGPGSTVTTTGPTQTVTRTVTGPATTVTQTTTQEQTVTDTVTGTVTVTVTGP